MEQNSGDSCGKARQPRPWLGARPRKAQLFCGISTTCSRWLLFFSKLWYLISGNVTLATYEKIRRVLNDKNLMSLLEGEMLQIEEKNQIKANSV